LNTALALRSAGRLARSARPGSGTALQTAAGSISAFFTLEGFDQRRGVATYALRIVNGTKSVLICRTWLTRNGDSIFATPDLLEILPSSTTTTQFSIVPRDVGPFDRAVAEIAVTKRQNDSLKNCGPFDASESVGEAALQFADHAPQVETRRTGESTIRRIDLHAM
jgi:hypothetical protein